MMQPEILQPTWPFYETVNSPDDQAMENYDINVYAGGCEFSSSFTSADDFFDFSSIPYVSSEFSSEFIQFPAIDDELQAMLPMEDFPLEMEMFKPILSDELYGCFEESEGSFPSQMSSRGEDVWSPSTPIKSSELSTDTALTLPEEDMEVENQLSVSHLLKAYGEALEEGKTELAEVIIRCLSEKVNPAGETLERLAFNLSSDHEKQGDYLRQECSKNFVDAFRAFYQLFPYGRFAHFSANSAILEAMPDDAELIHIVDSDLREGVQWPPLIEAIARRNKTLRLTSIKRENEDSTCAPLPWSFEETGRSLCDYAGSFGLKLKVEEMGIEELVNEMKKKKKIGCSREWLVFNCMVGLPHMGRERSRKAVKEFLWVAKEILSSSGHISKNRGIVTLADGGACERLTGCSGFGSFFEGYLEHYQALLESMKSSFPKHLAEARMAMDCLFVAPSISPHDWLKKWEEVKQGYHLQARVGLEECKLSSDILTEAQQMVKNQSSYSVRKGGCSENEMILEWSGIPLVSFSTWRS